jgi:ATP-dependent RNA helicase DeaD
MHPDEDSSSPGPRTPQEPDSLREPERALPQMTLQDLPPVVREAIARAGWPQLMPVQAKAMPYLLQRRDLMVQSRTGSGKTGAFLLPMLTLLDPSVAACQALILVPTRELALQVADQAELLTSGAGFRTVTLYGGAAYGPQIDGLRGGAQIAVGTPGRILDHLLKGTFSLEGLKVLVFDEADRMLSMGFYPDMRRIQRHLPRHRVSAYLFSATFPPYVLRLAGEFLREPDLLSLSRDHVHVAEVEHVYCVVPVMRKDRALVKLIEAENPQAALIFCNTKTNVHYVATVLKRFGYDADETSSDLTQVQRERVMARIRSGSLRFLVATDVAARGIDLPEISHVFLYEPPEDPEAYIHRAGRTGRAGAGGTAITLVQGMEEIELKRIAKGFGIEMIERPVPSDEEVEALVAQRLTAILEARLRGKDNVQREQMRRFLPLARALGQTEDEWELVAMLLDEAYQQSLHAPVVEAGEPEPKKPRPAPSEGRPRPRRRR